MAGEAAQQGVLSDEAKVAAGKLGSRCQSTDPASGAPNDLERRGRNYGLKGRAEDRRVGGHNVKI